MGELNEEFVDPAPLLEEGNSAVRLDYAEQDCARRASGTWAKRGRGARNAFAGLRHVGLTNLLL
jgi:hypothetical protein